MVNRLARFLRRFLALAAMVTLAVGCGGGLALELKLLGGIAQKPSNVAVYFTVDTRAQRPVTGLTADHFTVYENGAKVSTIDSKQTILDAKLSAAHYTLLLVDTSGSIVNAKKMGDVVNAAGKFTSKVERYQKVAIAAFDGGPELYGIVPFTENPEAAQSGVDKLLTFKPKNPSTNLNGAVLEGLKTLRKALDADPRAIKGGTLVVFTDGTDRANRVSRKDLHDAMGQKAYLHFDVFAIGVGAESEYAHLEEIGRSGTVREDDAAKMEKAFDEIATKIIENTERYYLFSYCTSWRSGIHEVRIEARTNDGAVGSITYKFNADGFGPGCDPNTPPNFDPSQPAAPTEATGAPSVKVEKK